MKHSIFFLVTIAALLVSTVNGWWAMGHLLTARLAQHILETSDDKHDQEILNSVLDILDLLRQSNSTKTKLESKHPFTECATYADAIKKYGHWQNQWHFVNTPFFDQGGNISDYPKLKIPEHNGTETIEAISKWISDEEGFKDTYQYKTVMENVLNENEGLSTAMRFLIHYVGDMHQPLHSSTRVNPNYTRGDMGGNLFYLPEEDLKELHAVWDSVFMEFTDDPELPLNDDWWQKLTDIALRLNNKHEVYKWEVENLEPASWAHESFSLTKIFVYKNIKENQKLDDEYIRVGQSIAERRVVVGGHRLANLIRSLDPVGKHQPKEQDVGFLQTQ